MTNQKTQNIAVLGSTGSIGVSTLDVLSRHPQEYRVYALSAHRNVDVMLQQCLAVTPMYAVMVDEIAAQTLRDALSQHNSPTEVLQGSSALETMAEHGEVDVVMAAIVGAAGLPSSMAAAKAGKKILLANKEALVMAGDLFMQAVQQGSATLLPIDSEHNAIFQCLAGSDQKSIQSDVRRILLTGSGGPFRQTPLKELGDITPAQACAHPNWSMGKKISVDSATMMNKGLELIEACWLFSCSEAQVDIVIHPQSVIHSMVEYVDGSVLAQMGNPDMRTPIAYGLAWPQRIDSGVSSLDLLATARLDFEAPDEQRFPALRLARKAAQQGGTAPTVLSAANEVAVAAFLAEKIAFLDIVSCVGSVLEGVKEENKVSSLDDIYNADTQARQLAEQWLSERAKP